MSQSLRAALTGVSLALLIIFAFGYFAVDIAQSQTPTEQPSDPSETPTTQPTDGTEEPTGPIPTGTDGEDQVTTDRLGGQNRYETSVEISQESFPNGADDVFLARADIFPDALSAGSLTTGPILLVDQCGPLHPAVEDEIERLQPNRVVALGGVDAVCEQVLQDAADAARGDGNGTENPSESPSPSETPTGSETPSEACTEGPLPPIIGEECPTATETPDASETPTGSETPDASDTPEPSESVEPSPTETETPA